MKDGVVKNEPQHHHEYVQVYKRMYSVGGIKRKVEGGSELLYV